MRKWKLEIVRNYAYSTRLGRNKYKTYKVRGTYCMIFTDEGKNVWSGIGNPETIQDLIDKHNDEVSQWEQKIDKMMEKSGVLYYGSKFSR